MGGTPFQGRRACLATTIATALFITLCAVPAAQAVSQKQAERRALKALGVKKGDDPVIVFKLDRTLRPGARIGEAGTDRMPRGGGAGSRVDGATGVVSSRTPGVGRLRLRGERAYFFYADLGPFQTYQHPGRVALVGKKSGRVRTSKQLMWAPLINGRLPAFMRNAKAYHDRDHWAFYRPWHEGATAQAAENRGPIGLPMLDPPLVDMPLRGRAAGLLAAERACSLRFSDTLGDFYDFGAVDRTRGWIGATFRRLEDLNPGFVDERYVLASGMTPMEFAEDVIAGSGCRSVLLYLAGGAWASGPSGVTVGIKPAGARRVRQQHIAAQQLRSLLRRHLDLRFMVIVDAPYAGGFADSLSGEGNALVVATPGGSRARTFSYLPEVEMPGGRLRRHPGNPHGLLEFTNRALFGLERFLGSATEIETGAQQASFLAWMITRAFALGAGQGIGGAPPPVNRPPTAGPATVSTDEDTPVEILLPAADPDGDPLSTSITGPSNGTLSGGRTLVTYTPKRDFNGTDSFVYSVGDGRGGTADAVVTIVVEPVNDAPGITTSSGAASFTEDTAPVAVDPGLTVADVDDTELDRASVVIESVAAGDQLQLSTTPSGIAESYDALTGTLTLMGPASLSAYEVALRSVTYRTTADEPPAERTMRFSADDGDGFGPEAQRDVEVTPFDDAPVAVDDSSTVDEDAPATAIDVLANDTDVDDGPMTIASASDPANGTVVVMGGGTGLTYQPDPTYCGPDSFDYTLNGGDTATVSITVTCVDNSPVAIDDAATVAEDSGATAIDVLANDTDIDGGPKTIASASDPANGTVVVTGGGTGLTYAPDSQFCGADSFTYSLNGGSTGTVSVTVSCVADDPTVDTSAGATSYTENDPATAIDPAVTVTDPDAGAQITGATVRITGGYAGAEDLLALAGSHAPITPSVSGDTLTLGGTASVAAYQAALRDVTYRNSSDAPSTAPRTITFSATDETARTGSDTKGLTVTAVDDPPDAVSDSATLLEDASATAIDVLANDPDVDGGPKAIGSVSQPANGTVVITGGGTGLTYQPDADYCGPDSFDYTLNGGDTATVSITVTCVDDAPVAVDDAATVDEDSGAGAIDVLANDTDVDGGPMTIQSASDPANGTVVVTGGGTGLTYAPDSQFCGSDTFTYTLNGGSTATVSVTVTCVADDPVVDTSPGNTSYTEDDPATAIDPAVTVADADAGAAITGATVQITGGYAGSQDILALAGSHAPITPSVSGDTLTLTGTASPAAYQAALRDVTYRNDSQAPSSAARTITFSATDNTARTGSDTKGLTVISVDDPPVAAADSATVLEDASATAIDVLGNDTDVDGGTKLITSAGDPANGTVVVTGGGTGLTYQPDPNYCNNPPGTAPDTFNYTITGGSTATVSVTVTCVNDAPNADDETISGASGAIGNTTLIVNDADDGAPSPSHPKKTVSGDLLAGDSDVDGPGPLTITPGTFATNDGGSVTIESDGDFSFHPAASTSCTDTSDFFDYTVSDQNATGPGPTPGTDTGRVTIQIAGCVWYVSNNAAGNSGTANAPFDTLAQAETASGANHTVFVFDGDNTATGLGGDGYAMNAGERLIGEHEGLQVGVDNLHPANANAHPTLTATNADVIALDDGNELRGINVDPQGTGGGIAGGAGDTGGTIDDVNVVDTLGAAGTQAGLGLNGTSGTFTVTNLAVTNNATGVLLTNAGTTDFGSTTITSTGAPGLSATGTTNMSTSTFDAITVTGSGNGGVSMSGTSGTTTFGDLSLTTTGGTGFLLSNAGSVSVPSGGTANVSATGGPAVDVTGTSGASLAFDTVSSTGSATDGINLAGLNGGTFSATGGTISGAAGIAFDLDGGSGAISYPGTIGDGSGQTARITGRGAGSVVTLNGAIADGADAGGGISLSGNTGGSTTFGNASKVLNTTTSNAVSFTNSDGHSLLLTGGGLDIDTTSGQGLVATTSGTIVVAGTGNSVTSTSGRAVNVQNTDLGASGFTFQSVSSNGAPNGILLSNTGTSAGMTVTGTGAHNSGGAIQNATEHGVSLATTSNFNADELSITGANFAGVDGTDVTNFTFTDGEIVGAGDSLTNDAHAAFAFNDVGANNVDGALTITGNSVTNPYGGGVQIRNASGTISQATVSTNTFQSTADPATSKQDGVSFHIEGTPATAAGLTQAAISGNSILNFPSGNGVELVGEQITSIAGPRASFGVPDSTTNRIVVSNNEIRGNATNKMGAFGVAASVTGMADGNVRIANNGTAAVPMQNILGEGIGVGASGTANADFIVEDNFVSPGNVLGNVGISANANRRTVGATTVATPDVNATIQDNVVSNTSGAGIKVLHFNSNGNLRAKIVNNAVSAPVQPNPGIAVENGSSNDPAFNPTLCAQISGNPATGSGPDGFGNTFPGIDLIERGGSNAAYQLQLHGLTPNPATAAQTESYLAGQNPASSLGGGFYVGKRASVSEGNQFEPCTITF